MEKNFQSLQVDSPQLAAFRNHSVRGVLLSEVEPQSVRVERIKYPEYQNIGVQSFFFFQLTNNIIHSRAANNEAN
jgi:hypothetical protein